jgi:hypothetical protein
MDGRPQHIWTDERLDDLKAQLARTDLALAEVQAETRKHVARLEKQIRAEADQRYDSLFRLERVLIWGLIMIAVALIFSRAVAEHRADRTPPQSQIRYEVARQDFVSARLL